jgi:hypothetical protein
MLYRLAADAVLVAHLGFIVFVLFARVRQFEAKNSVFWKVPHVTMRVSGGFS